MAHLPTDLVLRLLNDDTFRPGGRPSHFRGIAPDALTGAPPETIDNPGSAAGWVFKESTVGIETLTMKIFGAPKEKDDTMKNRLQLVACMLFNSEEAGIHEALTRIVAQ